MQTKFIQLAAGVAVTFLAVGCDRLTRSAGTDLDRNPDYRRARQAADAGDARVAVALFEKTLRSAPGVASVHLELGLLYDQKLNDPIAAIYHYRQFLELEPATDRKNIVEGHIERAKLTLAARLPAPSVSDPGEVMRLQSEKAALQQELASLRLRLAELEQAGSVAVSTALPVEPPRLVVVTQTVAQVTPPAPPPVAPRYYLVKSGDTLQSIARAYYGTAAGWERIYQANRASLPNKDQLRIGQQLLIP
jgi:LysM repeat protein